MLTNPIDCPRCGIEPEDELAWYEWILRHDEHLLLDGITFPEGVELQLTCRTCPEQYDVFYRHGDNRRRIGYLRFRHSRFRADWPDCGGTTVLVHEFPEYEYEWTDEERARLLTLAVKRLLMEELTTSGALGLNRTPGDPQRDAPLTSHATGTDAFRPTATSGPE